jgi:serine/threonine protein kinase
VTTETVAFQHFRIARREDGSLFELGRGAMGVTYKAQDTELGGFVALKVINAQLLDSDTARERFLREARAAAYLHHANVASVFHLGREANIYFYAMEFVEGETLDDFVKRRGPLPERLALRIALQAASGLGAANERGLIHRDIKPANLMLARPGANRPTEAEPQTEDEEDDDELLVKVIDFGLAKSLRKEDHNNSALSLTNQGPIGTPFYMSPEQIEQVGPPIDARSDIYSLGVTLWHLLVGQPPFQGSQFQVLSQHITQPPPLEKLQAAGVSPGTVSLLSRMLAKSPADRPANHRELIGAIKGLLRHSPPAATSSPGIPQINTAQPQSASSAGITQASLTLPGALSSAGRRRRRRKQWRLFALAILFMSAQAGAAVWWFAGVYLPEQRRKQEADRQAQLLREEAEQEHALMAPMRARVWHVPADAPTIQAAIDFAQPEDTVQIAAGQYEEAIRFKEGIHLVGDGMEAVTIRAGSNASALTVDQCKFGLISDICFEQTPGNAAEAQLPAVSIKSSGVRMVRCRVKNAASYGIYIRGQDHSMIEECEVSGCGADGIHAMDPGAAPTIRKNHSFDNRMNGILLHLGAAGLIQGNVSEGNGGNGVAMMGNGVTPQVSGNQCDRNQKWGIFVEKTSSPKIEPNNRYNSNKLGDFYREK